MDKECHIFDLENTIWSIHRKVWVIDKRYPAEPLFKIDESEYSLIKSGVFKSQKNKVNYSGESYYVNNKMREVIEKHCPLVYVGFSLREFNDKNIIDDLEFDIHVDRIEKLKSKNADVSIVSDNPKDYYSKSIKKLEDKIEEIGHNIKDYYHISESPSIKDNDEITWTKGVIILKNLIGLNVKDSQFINEACDKYNIVQFYDSNKWILSNLKNINNQFEVIYHKSSESVQDLINERLKTKMILVLNECSNNEMNMIIPTKVNIIKPSQVLLFESFKMFKK